MLLATTREQEGNTSNPRFHSLNQAIVQLVGICFSAAYTISFWLRLLSPTPAID